MPQGVFVPKTAADVAAARANNQTAALIDRLTLTPERIAAAAAPAVPRADRPQPHHASHRNAHQLLRPN